VVTISPSPLLVSLDRAVLSLLSTTKAHYEALRGDARREAGLALQALGMDVRVMGWSRRTSLAVDQQWAGGVWDWDEIMRRYNDIKRLDVAVWARDERLVMVSLATMTRAAITVRYVQGDPREGCEFKGKRIPMALEAATRFAQKSGVPELRIQPINDALVHLYETHYGFTLVTPRGEAPYWSRVI